MYVAPPILHFFWSALRLTRRHILHDCQERNVKHGIGFVYNFLNRYLYLTLWKSGAGGRETGRHAAGTKVIPLLLES
jgi:hypothetical protein